MQTTLKEKTKMFFKQKENDSIWKLGDARSNEEQQKAKKACQPKWMLSV